LLYYYIFIKKVIKIVVEAVEVVEGKKQIIGKLDRPSNENEKVIFYPPQPPPSTPMQFSSN
jgi:hypothetical protein